jgi:hypothetical protein
VGQGGPGHPGDPDHVDVEHPGPLGVVVGGDVALGADPGVVDDHVEPAEVAGDPVNGPVDRRPVGDVAGQAEVPVAGGPRVEVEHGRAGAAVGQQVGGGGPDPAGAARDQRHHPVELPHRALPRPVD